MIDSTKESIEWIKPIKGQENYLITNTGAIWSRNRNKWLKFTSSETGHLFVDLGIEHKHKFVHRLVFETFVRPIRKGEIIHHLDQNPQNNNIENLNAITRAEHMKIHKEGCKLSQQHKRKKSKAMKEYWNKRKGE